MKINGKIKLKSEIRNVLRCMDFISKNFLCSGSKGGKEILSNRYYDIYQNLALAWEYLSLQCKHNEGYKKLKNGEDACSVCGKIRNTPASCYLLSVRGEKKIGNKTQPNSKKTCNTKKEAVLINDSLSFHGSRVNVNVSNAYQSTLFRGKHTITVAADRSVTVREDGVECNINQFTACLDLLKKRKKPWYSAFPWELHKSELKRFPVLLKYDDKYRFAGLTVLRSGKKSKMDNEN